MEFLLILQLCQIGFQNIRAFIDAQRVDRQVLAVLSVESYRTSIVCGTVSEAARSLSTCVKISRGPAVHQHVPSCMTTTRCACTASSIWWVMRMTVMPYLRLSSRDAHDLAAALRVEHGGRLSSSTTQRGIMAITPAMATRCF